MSAKETSTKIRTIAKILEEIAKSIESDNPDDWVIEYSNTLFPDLKALRDENEKFNLKDNLNKQILDFFGFIEQLKADVAMVEEYEKFEKYL